MSKKIAGIGIGIGIATTIVALVFFTNVDDMVLETVSDTISEVQVSNPLQTYEINTKEEFYCKVDVQDIANTAKDLMSSHEKFEQKYPEVVSEMTEYANSGQFEKDYSTVTDASLPRRAVEILLPVFMTEFSINPELEGWFLDYMNGKIPDSEIRDLAKKQC